MNSNDGLSFSSAIDTSEFDKGLAHIENSINQVASSVESESARIQSLFTDIPKIDLNMSAIGNLDEVELGFQQVGRVIEENRAAIAELEAKYRDLKAAAGRSV